jgi:hypothetical protein
VGCEDDVFMHAQVVRTTIEVNPKIDETKDEEAFSIVAQVVPDVVFMKISNYVKEMHADDNRVKKTHVQCWGDDPRYAKAMPNRMV